MGATKKVDNAIIEYLPALSQKQKELVLTVVKGFARDAEELKDTARFDEEMLQRLEDMESGKVNGITLEELETRAIASFKSKLK